MKQDWLQTHRGSFWGQIDVTDTPSRFSGAQGITPFPGEITDLTTTSCAQTRLWSIQSWQKQLICWNADARWVKAMVHPKINICWTCAHPQALKMLTDGLEWCGLLWCFYQLFGLSFWRHPFTAEDPLLRHWCRDTFLQTWWRNKLILILDGPKVEHIFCKY